MTEKYDPHQNATAERINGILQQEFIPDIKRKIVSNGVFDYDGVIFSTLWDAQPSDLKAYCRYNISDHRPMWVEIDFDKG